MSESEETSSTNDSVTSHKQFSFQSAIGQSDDSEQMENLSCYKYDEESIRVALAKMVVLDELPFEFVEGAGFKKFSESICPEFHIPSRWTIGRDIHKLFCDEKTKLKEFLRKSSNFVCLTTDTWTSIQKVNYMCLTAHWVDEEWILQKRVLNFIPITSHKGEDLGRAIEECLQDWGIDKVLIITVDNASSNDVMVAYLKKKIKHWGMSPMGGQYMHMRCIAHIINLVVQDGLKESIDAITRIRNAVRYVMASPSRWAKWKECVKKEKINESEKEDYHGLCLDVSTRWTSTYLMLNAAMICQAAFERYEEMDASFRNDVDVGEMPFDEDWVVVNSLCAFLRRFYKLTLCVSGTLYVTSNIVLEQICNMSFFMTKATRKDDVIGAMGRHMKEKYDKYWGNFEKLNVFIFIPVIFDPRYKLDFVQFAFKQMLSDSSSDLLATKVQEVLKSFFEEYHKEHATNVGASSQVEESLMFTPSHEMDDEENFFQAYKRMRMTNQNEPSFTELEKYLNETSEPLVEKFDVLNYWKVNSSRFPVLSKMARDILAIPVSTVSSESDFSTGGRVLDCFRSSLQPKTVETLICTQDWLRASLRIPMFSIEEDVSDAELMEKEMSQMPHPQPDDDAPSN